MLPHSSPHSLPRLGRVLPRVQVRGEGLFVDHVSGSEGPNMRRRKNYGSPGMKVYDDPAQQVPCPLYA
jgi:hypothetical protein